MDKIYTKAYYRAKLNWDWEYNELPKRKRWSKVQTWIVNRMRRRNQVGMLSEIARSLD